jgi:hypothetical protein
MLVIGVLADCIRHVGNARQIPQVERGTRRAGCEHGGALVFLVSLLITSTYPNVRFLSRIAHGYSCLSYITIVPVTGMLA